MKVQVNPDICAGFGINTPEQVKLGLPVELELRRIHQVGGRPNYYWKGTPVPEESASA